MTGSGIFDLHAYGLGIEIPWSAEEAAGVAQAWTASVAAVVDGGTDPDSWSVLVGREWRPIEIESRSALLDALLERSRDGDTEFEHIDGTVNRDPAPDAISGTGYALTVSLGGDDELVISITGGTHMLPRVASVRGPIDSPSVHVRPLVDAAVAVLAPDYVNVAQRSTQRAVQRSVRTGTGRVGELAGTKWVRTQVPFARLPDAVTQVPLADGHLLTVGDGAPSLHETVDLSTAVDASQLMTSGRDGDLEYHEVVAGTRGRPRRQLVRFDGERNDRTLVWALMTDKDLAADDITRLEREVRRQQRVLPKGSVEWVISDDKALPTIQRIIDDASPSSTSISLRCEPYPPIMERLRRRLAGETSNTAESG